MPAFSNQLPTQQKHMGYDIKRTPAASPLRAIVTSDDILVCNTHFWHGRTLPCERMQTDAAGNVTAGDCQPCNDAMPYRTHVYVSAFDGKTHEHFIFECTSNAAKAFAEHRAAAGTLRGCGFQASRPKCGKNSKVIIELIATNPARLQLPEAPNLIKALCVIWRLPNPDLRLTSELAAGMNAADGYATRQPTFHPDAESLKTQRVQADNANGETAFHERREELLAAFNNPDPTKPEKKNGKPKCEHAPA